MEPEHFSEANTTDSNVPLFSEDTTRIVLESAPIGIVVVDVAGYIVLVNHSAQRLFGYTETELLGRPLTLLVPEEIRQIHAQRYIEYTRDPRIRPMGSGLNLNGRRKDGSIFPVEVSLGFAETRLGLLSIAFVSDITKQRESERLRDTMIHTLVHDLRNPLGTISTGLQVLQMGATKLDQEQQAVLGIALRGSERMLKLINAILEVNQLESGKLSLNPTTFRIQDQIAEMLALLSPLAEEKSQRLLNSADADLPAVYADSVLINRVLENLIGNAIKYTPSSGVIQVGAQRDSNDPTKLRVDVSDNGPGIAPELMPRLFGKFISGANKDRGHGLGLAFCKLAIEAHKEQIAVHSSADEGTTFWFTLPIATPESIDSTESEV